MKYLKILFSAALISMIGYSSLFAALKSGPIYEVNKWYRIQKENDTGKMKYLFFVNEDGVILYFDSFNDGKLIAVGIKYYKQILTKKIPSYRSRSFSWKHVEFIYSPNQGQLLLNNEEWIWAIGENGVVKTNIFKEILENNEIKFKFYSRSGPIETQFKFDSKEMLKHFRWLINNPNLKIE